MTGMRRGEPLALRWTDMDLEAREVTIARSLIAFGYAVSESDPKTDRSARTVALDAGTVEALRAHRRAQAEERLAFGPAYQDHGLVFCREDGALLHPDQVTARFLVLAKAAGLPRIRLHDLRHGHVTLALKAGVDLRLMADRVGHSSIAVTADIYSHVSREMREDVAEQVAALVSR